MTAPRVSILIPTYRYAGYLREAMDSVLSQNFTDFEVLASDDCSGDGSAELLQEYARCDPRVRVHIHPSNVGMVQNWNWCLARARGEYVQFVFGDDLLACSDSIGKMVAMLEANPEAVLAACARNVIDEKSHVVEVWSALGASGVNASGQTMLRCLMEGNLIGEPTAVMFRRSAAVRGFSEAYDQMVDLEMWFHLLTQGPVVYTRESLCGFRRHALQRTQTNTLKGVYESEILRLTLDYYNSMSFNRKDVQRVLFHRLYKSRRYVSDPDVAAARKQLFERLGFINYCMRWGLKKFVNPASELLRWVNKRKRAVLR